MMILNKRKKLLIVLLAAGILILLLAVDVSNSHAEADRIIAVEIYTIDAYHWQFRRWADGMLQCDIYLPESGMPGIVDIKGYCGAAVFTDWLNTPPCQQALTGEELEELEECSGVFIQYLGVKEHEVIEYIELPEAHVNLELSNCTPGFWCDDRPELEFIASEPLESHEIIEINIKVNDRLVTCPASACRIRIPLTDADGIVVEYWAVSTFGDETEHKTVRVRNLVSEKGAIKFRIELLGEEWAQIAPGCSVIWDSFPDADANVDWLKQVDEPQDLYTNDPLSFLAGQLIWTGKADASNCLSQGLTLGGGWADTCGQEAAQSEVEQWQNQFNVDFYQASIEVNVPARILKGVVAQESQFWSESIEEHEYGLGYLTESGVDMALNWNTSYFLRECIPLLGLNKCMGGYSSLSTADQGFLRGVSLKKVGTEGEISLIAETLVGACAQAGQVVTNATGFRPGALVAYDELWQMSLAIYNSGSGCVADAVYAVWKLGGELTWDRVSAQMDATCHSSIDYVNRVIFYAP